MRSSCFAERALRLLGCLLLAVPLACGTLSVSEEQALGTQVSGELRGQLRFVDDRATVAYVRAIGEDLVQAAGPQPFTYRFYVVDNPQINAFAVPAGHVYIHTGVILEARNVSELAGVIAHEVGHVARRHVAKSYGRQQGTGVLYELGVIAASAYGLGSAASLGGQLAAQAYLTKFGRDAEREADAFAVEVLPAAGYDPQGLVTFFEKLQRSGGSGGGFLSSHPATSERIENTQRLIDELPPQSGLRLRDRGKLEIIQQRIRVLTGGSP